MNLISRIITGGATIILSVLFIIYVGVVEGPGVDVFAIIIGTIFLIIGAYIFLNKDEDKIEKIKSGGKK